MEFVFDIQPKFLPQGAFESRNDESLTIANADVPWLLTSQARGLTRCELPLVGPQDPPTPYRVKLHFAELDEQIKPGQRVFDVKLQGTTVAEQLDVAREAAGVRRGLTREFADVQVANSLVIELVPIAGQPILSAIEVASE